MVFPGCFPIWVRYQDCRAHSALPTRLKSTASADGCWAKIIVSINCPEIQPFLLDIFAKHLQIFIYNHFWTLRWKVELLTVYVNGRVYPSLLIPWLHYPAMLAGRTIQQSWNWTNIFLFWLKRLWSLFLMVQLTNNINSINGLVPYRRGTITRNIEYHYSVAIPSGHTTH